MVVGVAGTAAVGTLAAAVTAAAIAVVALADFGTVAWPDVAEFVKKFAIWLEGDPNAENDTLRQIIEQHHDELAASKRAEQDAKAALKLGIQPVEFPTEEEYQSAMSRIGYDAKKLHFAICGVSGSGKSSLINAFRGLEGLESDAAPVGVTETTSEINRYPDPRLELPFSRMVWYDIPGAGTLSVPDWQYFNTQGLFVFDFIIVVYDGRFTEVEAGIIENCYRFSIPVLIVRSKSDTHISNMLRVEDQVTHQNPEYAKKFQEKIPKFVQKTRQNFSQQMELMKKASKEREKALDRSDPKFESETRFEKSYQKGLSEQEVYIVAATELQALQLGKPPSQTKLQNHIHEMSLFMAVLKTATKRRYDPRGSKSIPGPPYTLLQSSYSL